MQNKHRNLKYHDHTRQSSNSGEFIKLRQSGALEILRHEKIEGLEKPHFVSQLPERPSVPTFPAPIIAQWKKDSFEVGYDSSSRFSREYSRLFGAPPLRDITNLRQATMVDT